MKSDMVVAMIYLSRVLTCAFVYAHNEYDSTLVSIVKWRVGGFGGPLSSSRSHSVVLRLYRGG
jgi:hypothetical protein